MKRTLKEYLKENSGTKTALSREQFGELLARSQLGTDENMIDKLFWYCIGIYLSSWNRIFDEDGNGDVDYKELAVGIEFLAEGDSEEKLQRMCA